MYIPKNFLLTDQNEISEFMQRYSFATLVSMDAELPVATHLPFIVAKRGEELVLTAHFARANMQWENLINGKVLVIFAEPHAYISTKNYELDLNVPTWNYFAVHAYGDARLLPDVQDTLSVLEATILNYEADYKVQWDAFPEDYKLKMIKGIVAFEICVTDLQAKKKLSQNRTDQEKKQIIDTLAQSDASHERAVAEYMDK